MHLHDPLVDLLSDSVSLNLRGVMPLIENWIFRDTLMNDWEGVWHQGLIKWIIVCLRSIKCILKIFISLIFSLSFPCSLRGRSLRTVRTLCWSIRAQNLVVLQMIWSQSSSSISNILKVFSFEILSCLWRQTLYLLDHISWLLLFDPFNLLSLIFLLALPLCSEVKS